MMWSSMKFVRKPEKVCFHKAKCTDLRRGILQHDAAPQNSRRQ